MKEQSAIEKMLEQMGDLLQFVAEKKGQPLDKKLPDDIEEKLNALEKDVALFRQINEDIFEALGVTAQDLEKPSKKVPIDRRTTIERARKLRKDIQAEHRYYSMLASQAKQIKKEGSVGKAEKRAKQRKKKFKRVGGYKHWKPL